jgi:hypothetical protein
MTSSTSNSSLKTEPEPVGSVVGSSGPVIVRGMGVLSHPLHMLWRVARWKNIAYSLCGENGFRMRCGVAGFGLDFMGDGGHTIGPEGGAR